MRMKIISACRSNIAAKFKPQALKEFLLSPEKLYNWTKMPNFKFSDQEAEDLATFLIKKSHSENFASFKADATVGKNSLLKKAVSIVTAAMSRVSSVLYHSIKFADSAKAAWKRVQKFPMARIVMKVINWSASSSKSITRSLAIAHTNLLRIKSKFSIVMPVTVAMA